MNYPRLSIVTPSYNQAAFLDEALASVRGQFYPNLEYIVLDGGSADASVEIIRSHETGIAFWRSEPDAGMYHALNAGFARATGDIFAWLNADDFYLPGALHFAARVLDPTRAELLLGNVFHFVEQRAEQWGSDVVAAHARKDLRLFDYVIQPATFWTRRAWEQTGKLDEAFQVVADWEWFLRAQKNGVHFLPHARYLAGYRLHSHNKTQAGGTARARELRRVLEIYAGPTYATLWDALVTQQDSLRALRQRLQRFPLNRAQNLILKIRYPKLARQLSAAQIWDWLEMLGS